MLDCAVSNFVPDAVRLTGGSITIARAAVTGGATWATGGDGTSTCVARTTATGGTPRVAGISGRSPPPLTVGVLVSLW